MDIQVYQAPGACSRVTLTALEEAGLPYQAYTVDLSNNIQRSERYLSVNPKGKVPALVIRGHLLTENPAIVYAIHGERLSAGLLPVGGEFPENYEGLSDLAWCASTLHPMVRQIRMPAKFTKGDSTGVSADGFDKLHAESVRLEERFSGGRWWYGERWSIIDVYINWAFSVAIKGGFQIDNYLNILNHSDRLRERPSVQRALDREITATKF